jgi:hypothetical protein
MFGDKAVPRQSVADRAKQLAREPAVIDSFRRFQGKPHYDLPQQTWFFAANSNLAGAVGRPRAAPTSWWDWDDNILGWRRRTVLANLAGLDPNRVPRTLASLVKLREAFNRWPAGRVAVFQGGEIYDEEGNPIPESRREKTNVCNIYVGEALFADGVDQRDPQGKYYSARQIYDGLAPYLVRVEQAEAARGDVAAWGRHVEIVMSLDQAAGTFCTVSSSGPDISQELCAEERRRLDNRVVRFFRYTPGRPPVQSP